MAGVPCEGTEDASERLDIRFFPNDFIKLEKRLVIFSQTNFNFWLGFSRQFFGDWTLWARDMV